MLMQNASMPETKDLVAMGERLAEARKLAGYDSPMDVHKQLGWVYSTYKNHEDGYRDFSKTATKYAAAFRVNLIWLLTGTGQPRPKGGNHPIVDLFYDIPERLHPQAIDYLNYLRERKE